MRNTTYTKHTVTLLLLLAVQVAVNGACYAQGESLKTPAGYKKEVSDSIRKLSSKSILVMPHDTTRIGELTREALHRYPDNSIAHESRGRLFLFLGNRKDNWSRKNEKTDTILSAQNKRNLYKARYHLINAINLDKGNISARHMMLNVETQLKEYSSALIYCNELLEVAPYDSTLWKKKIYLYHKLGNEVEADRLSKRYMSIYTNDTGFRKDEAALREENLKHQKGNASSMREKNLREMIDLDPRRPAYYYYLVSFLSSTGRQEEAADIAAAGANMCRSVKGDNVDGVIVDYSWLVEQHVRILCDLNRTKEAENYLLNLRKEHGYHNEELLSTIRLEMARSAKFNDPYEANAYIYETTKSPDALNYLINTAIQRGYYDDALGYIKKVKNPTWQLQLKRYTVYKRMGNTPKAMEMLTPAFLGTLPKDRRHDLICDLMQYKLREAKSMMSEDNYRSAISSLESLLQIDVTSIPLSTDDDIYAYQESALSNLYVCHLEKKDYDEAGKALNSLYMKFRQGDEAEYVLKRADLYVAMDSATLAMTTLHEYLDHHPENHLIRSAYEEIAIPHVKSLIDSKRIKEAGRCDSMALTVCPKNIDLLTYGVNIAQTLNDNALLQTRIDEGLKHYPNNRYFILKKAQRLQEQKKYSDAMTTIAPLFETYYGDSTIIGAYAENCYLQTDTLLRLCKKHPRNANTYISEIDSCHRAASILIPGNKTLAMARGRYYEAMSKSGEIRRMLCYKDSAYTCYRLCKGEFDSPAEYRRITNQLYNDSRPDELSFEYQHGISGEDAARTGTAYMSYKHTTKRGDEWTGGVAYAGRSGQAGSDLTDYTKGGIGFQLSAGLSHNFSHTFTGEAQVAWASHYFPSFVAKLGATWHLHREWDFNLHASYRRMEIYSGVYKASEFGEGYEIDYWEDSKVALWQFGTSAAKMFDKRFRLSAGVDGFLMDKSFYINGNAKCQYYPLEGSKNHFFVAGGLGTAPDGTMLDRAHSINFKDLNGFMSMGGYILLTGNIGFGLSGTWNTIYVRSERPTMTSEPSVMNGYKNYFYINANVVIKF